MAEAEAAPAAEPEPAECVKDEGADVNHKPYRLRRVPGGYAIVYPFTPMSRDEVIEHEVAVATSNIKDETRREGEANLLRDLYRTADSAGNNR